MKKNKMKKLASILGSVIAILIFITGLSFSEGLSPTSPPLTKAVNPITTSLQDISSVDIKAVVVKSWGTASAWEQLNNEWSMYGDKSIFIDTTLIDASSFTYEDLVNTGADVVILSDPAGGNKQYSNTEVNAIRQYALEGHNVIGTYMLFQFGSYDNRGLANIFGLKSDIEYNTETVSISNVFNQIDTENYLFTGIPGPSWTSEGYSYTQTPDDDLQWNPVDLAGAKLVAETDNFKGIISVYNQPNYTGIYISNMPEHYGGYFDKQLLYNAITYTTGWRNAYSTLFDSPHDLQLFRQYRDEIISKTVSGLIYTKILYWNSKAALQVFLDNPELVLEAKDLIEKNKVSIKEVLTSNRAIKVFRGSLFCDVNEGSSHRCMIYNTDEIASFLNNYAKKSPPVLKCIVRIVRRKMLKQKNRNRMFYGLRLN